MAATHDVSKQTLDLLEARLQRLTFALTGDDDADAESTPDNRSTAAARLRTLERQLTNLTAKSDSAAQVLNLHQNRPYLFHPSVSQKAPAELLPAALASLVLAHAHSYQRLAQQLSSLDNLSVPDPASLVPLVDLSPRIDKAANKHAELARQTALLRTRSAKLLEMWYLNGVLSMSEQWTDWEERLRDVEILVRRVEAAKKREDGMV